MENLIIYALSHPTTGEVRYIGKSECGLKRPRQHGSVSNLKKTNRPVVRWINKLRKHGMDYVIELIEECESREILMETEKFYIAYFRSLGFRLLNICDGGEGFTGHHTPEARAKIAAAGRGREMSPEAIEKSAAKRRGKKFTPEHRQALRKPHHKARGRIFSEEHRLAISRARKGHKPSPESVAKMAKSKGAKPFMDELGNVYQTQMEAGRKLGLDQGSVRSVLVGKSIQTGGHTFAYLDVLRPGQLPMPRAKIKGKGGRPPKSKISLAILIPHGTFQ